MVVEEKSPRSEPWVFQIAEAGTSLNAAECRVEVCAKSGRRGPVKMPERRFPPPWTIEEHNNACFIVKDHNGQALAYVYFEEKPGRRAAASLLTRFGALRPT
jgi:hypothetical protein